MKAGWSRTEMCSALALSIERMVAMESVKSGNRCSLPCISYGIDNVENKLEKVIGGRYAGKNYFIK
jgi:hypothetical protein